MKILKVKCLSCMEVTSVMKDLLVPYQGKIIALKCSNSACGIQMKVQVPESFKKDEENIPSIQDFPPTEILIQNRTRPTIAKIRILKSDHSEEQVFELKEGINTIGRMSYAENTTNPDIPIFTSDKLISRNFHCDLLLSKKDGIVEVLLRDPKSRNGTFLQGSKIPLNHDDEIYLKDKDVFIIGETRIQIEFG